MTLEDLIKTFSEHAKKSKRSNEKLIKEFKKTNPGEPLPDHFKDDFCLPKALGFMCSEVLELKKKSEMKE